MKISAPYLLNAFVEAPEETSQRPRDMQLGSFNSLYPHRKKRIPNGSACSLCLRRENEVSAMVKHESGLLSSMNALKGCGVMGMRLTLECQSVRSDKNTVC